MTELRCVRCSQSACRQDEAVARFPAYCPQRAPELADVLASARAAYQEEETGAIARAAARTEAEGYCRDTRVEEVMAFARRLGVERIGIAFCIGLAEEARIFAEILEIHGFATASVVCKVGNVPKEEVGLLDSEKVRPGQDENLCNPVAQARLLDAAGCGLNVLLGLCVGHDTLFMRSSEAPCTVLAVKDRVLGHNPVAALYLAKSYYRRLRGM